MDKNTMQCDNQAAMPYDSQSIASSISDVSSVFAENKDTTLPQTDIPSWSGFVLIIFGYP